jgi:hypothetical protein
MRPRCFCEFPAGLASLSLRLHLDDDPIFSRMGNKMNYARAILAAMGLHPRDSADAFWWGEADSDLAALLLAYPNPEMLREIAKILYSWRGTAPRELWDAIRARRKEEGVLFDPKSMAEWIVLAAYSYRKGLPDSGYNPIMEERSFDRPPKWATLAERLANLSEAKGENLVRPFPDLSLFAPAKTETPPTKPADVKDVFFDRMAGWIIENAWSVSGGLYSGPDRGTKGPNCSSAITMKSIVDRVSRFSERTIHTNWPQVRVDLKIPTADEVAHALGTPGDLEGVIVYSDPPYLNTTGYKHDLSREAVVEMAESFSRLGAFVVISEAEALPELISKGWHSLDITTTRIGSARTFSKQQNEFLTMNKPPVTKPYVQVGLFG